MNIEYNEMVGIKVAVDVMLQSTVAFREVNIHSDCGTAILASSSTTVRSKVVEEYIIIDSIKLLY